MVDKKENTGLSSTALRYLAMALMLIDHMWRRLLRPNCPWMAWLGRLAFPIFAFLVAEGFYRTSNRKKYALRLFVCGVISELPFNMFINGSLLYPNHQNVMFTLLFGLLALWAFHWAREKGGAGRYLLSCAAYAALYVAADRLRVDYRALGMTTVVMFGLLRGVKWEKLWQALLLALICCLMPGSKTQIGNVVFSIQNIAVLALVPIWFYHGRRGAKNKLLQYGAYLFYPAHLFGIVLLRWIILRE